jgi:hypothetical protein
MILKLKYYIHINHDYINFDCNYYNLSSVTLGVEIYFNIFSILIFEYFNNNSIFYNKFV